MGLHLWLKSEVDFFFKRTLKQFEGKKARMNILC